MTLKYFIAFPALLLLAACGVDDEAPLSLRYSCDNGAVAEVAFSPERDMARLEIGALSYDLKAIGDNTYSNGQVIYTLGGDKVTISGADAEKPMTCTRTAPSSS